MNQIIVKRGAIFSLIFGLFSGLLSLFPPLVGYMLFIMAFLAAPIVIIYMKKNEKYLAFLTNQQGAIMGGVIGFFSTIGFFISFSIGVCILRLIFKTYYSYSIPYMLQSGAWLFFIIVFMVSLIFAMTNSATAMAITFLYGQIEVKPKDYDAPLDIKIDE